VQRSAELRSVAVAVCAFLAQRSAELGSVAVAVAVRAFGERGSLSFTLRDLALVPAGAQIFKNPEGVEPPSLATLFASMSERNHRQLTRIIDCNLITQPLE
jgi:hypothetical protein